MHSWMFQSSFEVFRVRLLQEHTITTNGPFWQRGNGYCIRYMCDYLDVGIAGRFCRLILLHHPSGH